jgi:sugar lactone lactonase YvrE
MNCATGLMLASTVSLLWWPGNNAQSPAAQVVRGQAATPTEEIAHTRLATVNGGLAAGTSDLKLEPVALIWGAMPAGVVVSRDGRIFLSFPRWSDTVEFSAGELTKDGRLVPYPSADLHRPGAEDRLVSVQGMDLDAQDRLWLLDAGAAKLVAVDLATDRVTKTIPIGSVVTRGAYLNDVRIRLAGDGDGGHAIIADSLGGGFVVVDLSTGKSWRRLQQHHSTRGEEGFVPEVEGKKLPSIRGNVDGIALSPDGKRLFYSPFSSRKLYALSTDALVDRALAEADVAARVEVVGEKPSANDGMTCDARGRVYSTDHEDNAIRRCDPAAEDPRKRVEVIVQDERLLWPDAVWVHGDWLYITTNQLNRLPGFHDGKDRREPPYAVFRYRLGE